MIVGATAVFTGSAGVSGTLCLPHRIGSIGTAELLMLTSAHTREQWRACRWGESGIARAARGRLRGAVLRSGSNPVAS